MRSISNYSKTRIVSDSTRHKLSKKLSGKPKKSKGIRFSEEFKLKRYNQYTYYFKNPNGEIISDRTIDNIAKRYDIKYWPLVGLYQRGESVS